MLNVTLTTDVLFPEGLIGGLLIGLSAALLLFANGRIAGISGIAGRACDLRALTTDRWRPWFIVGLLSGSAIYSVIADGLTIRMQADGLPLLGAAALVGIGTRLGSGCTSGHGVCGIGRRSGRSIVATVTFMAIAIGTVWFTGGALR